MAATEPCNRCDGPGDEAHECPFQVEVYDDTEYECTCCEECTQICKDDV